jgi:tetratricopeptide (TPR) repeat protein
VIVTSGELLRVRGEVEYQVLPLADADAIELFSQLSGGAPGPPVAELCRRLDNMPLALELAAARTKTLTPEQILDRLGNRLDLFKGGRDAEERQATLRGTIEWSHDLLDADEQRLFARLGVFAGGCTVETCEQICDPDLDTLQSLVEKSLVRHTEDRFWMLETIRDYAIERLDASGEGTALRERHAWCFLEMVERVEPELSSERQAFWLDALERDYANVRSALAWFTESGEAESSLRLAGALRPFWFRRGYLREGRRWLDEVLAMPAARSAARAKALATAGLLAALQSDWPETKRWSQAGYEASLDVGEPRYAAWSLMTLGRTALAEGESERAIALFEEAGRYGQEAGDASETMPLVPFNLGYLALSRRDFDDARRQFEQAVERFGHDRYGLARSLAALGSVELNQGPDDDAIATLQRSIEASREVGDRDDLAWALELIGVAHSRSDPLRAVRLLGAAELLRETLGGRLDGLELDLHEQALAALSAIDDEARAAAWEEGRRLSPNEAVGVRARGKKCARSFV